MRTLGQLNTVAIASKPPVKNSYRSRAGNDIAPVLCLDMNPEAHARKRTDVPGAWEDTASEVLAARYRACALPSDQLKN